MKNETIVTISYVENGNFLILYKILLVFLMLETFFTAVLSRNVEQKVL